MYNGTKCVHIYYIHIYMCVFIYVLLYTWNKTGDDRVSMEVNKDVVASLVDLNATGAALFDEGADKPTPILQNKISVSYHTADLARAAVVAAPAAKIITISWSRLTRARKRVTTSCFRGLFN